MTLSLGQHHQNLGVLRARSSAASLAAICAKVVIGLELDSTLGAKSIHAKMLAAWTGPQYDPDQFDAHRVPHPLQNLDPGSRTWWQPRQTEWPARIEKPQCPQKLLSLASAWWQWGQSLAAGWLTMVTVAATRSPKRLVSGASDFSDQPRVGSSVQGSDPPKDTLGCSSLVAS